MKQDVRVGLASDRSCWEFVNIEDMCVVHIFITLQRTIHPHIMEMVD